MTTFLILMSSIMFGYDFWKNNTRTVLALNNDQWEITKERSFPIGTLVRICPGEDIKKMGLYGIYGRKYHFWFDILYERLSDNYYFNDVENYVKNEYGECNFENYKRWIENNYKWIFE